MTWQDIVLSIGQIVFIIALLPSVFSKDKPAFTTSVMTVAVLITFAVVYFSLSLWLSFSCVIILILTWATLAVQKYLMNK